ncbi:nuclear protein MDM1 isoform X2 [Cololabis saira]|uniref:nuclear protein MDM1 isoform X2 n=1 Tax=Cololabis saira TaxID=129043 RepID=UPI002AD4BA92|nr:nuclear protein MDM1 isoform X2 [Cololabis saira]
MITGVISDQTDICREPHLQRKKKPVVLRAGRSYGSLLCVPDVHQSLAQSRTAPSAAPRSRSAHEETSVGQKPQMLLRAPANAGSPAKPESSAEHRYLADPERPGRPDTRSSVGSTTDGRSVKLHPSQPNSQPQPSKMGAAHDGQQSPANSVDYVLKRKAGLRPEGHRPGRQRSEYNRQFGWKKPVTASPLLTAEKVLYTSSRPIPPFKTNPFPVETEYRQSFQDLILPTRPRLQKHLENQQLPLFHTQMTNRRKEDSQKKPRSKQDSPQRENMEPQSPLRVTPPPSPQVQRGRRVLTEYESSFRSPLYRNSKGRGDTGAVTLQVKELREMAQLYRHRGWGTNFSRDHLGQLLSDRNTLWELTDTTESRTDAPTLRLTADLSPDSDCRSISSVEALDLASNSSKMSSVAGSGETYRYKKKAQTSPGPLTERLTAWEEEAEQDTDDEEGRLPTPRLKTKPVQRTHHDPTTPATGGAILVGKMKSADGSSPNKQQRFGSAVPSANEAESNVPPKRKEAWTGNLAISSSPSPEHKPALSPPSNRKKKAPASPAAPPPLVPPPQHVIQGTLRHPDFQHNGNLGLRFRELPCPGGGCGSDEDDRLSAISWHSAASCSAASAVLERARRRRENYWGKT